jgi:hypothetical protein
MRTTLDIAVDVLLAAKERARQEGRTAGEVISDLARRSLIAVPLVLGVEEPKSVYGFKPFPPTGTIVTNELINQLRDDDVY